MRHDPGNPGIAEIRRRFSEVAGRFEQADYVHRASCEGLIDRLGPVRIAPRTILDLGAATGGSGRALSKVYRNATVICLDASADMLRIATRSRGFLTKYRPVGIQANALQIPLLPGSVDLVFCNMMLPWIADLPACFAEVARVLSKGGVFAFSTLGPDSMSELREAWASIGETGRVHEFADMHVVGDALMQSGLADPVLDVDRLEISYPSVNKLLDDLNDCGASNDPFLGDPLAENQARLKSMLEALAGQGRQGNLSLDRERVEGHAWGVGPRAPAVEPPARAVVIDGLRE